MKMRDKWNKIKIKLKKTKKLTEIGDAFSLQKNIYYNIITMKKYDDNTKIQRSRENVKKGMGTYKKRN